MLCSQQRNWFYELISVFNYLVLDFSTFLNQQKALFVNLIGSIERHRAQAPSRERVLSLTIVNDVYNKQIATHFKLGEMVVIKRLGKGGYGTVHLVSTPETKSIHLALKMISKYTIVKNHQEKYILRERVKFKRSTLFL